MTTRVFTYSLVSAIVLVALIGGAWYFLAPTEQAAAMPGSISGTVLYPSEFIPPQRVCAIPVDGTDNDAVCIDTQGTPPAPPDFKISKLAPGDYYVYAKLTNPADIGSDISGTYRAYYNEYVRCGLKYGCSDATKIVVHVSAGADTPGISPHDWYH